MADEPELPERRMAPGLTEFRLGRVEAEVEKTNAVVTSLDNKFDGLRADLFERSVFVTLTTLELQLQQRDLRISQLETVRVTDEEKKLSSSTIKWGIAGAILAAIASPIITTLLAIVFLKEHV